MRINRFTYEYQLQIAPLLEKVFATDDADATLNMMLAYASAKYIGSPMPKPNVFPSFGRSVTNIYFFGNRLTQIIEMMSS